MVTERVKELIGILMIGDGALGVIEPRRHTLLWRRGPAPWRAMVDPFVQRPTLTRCIGALEVALGFWLAARQVPRWETERSLDVAFPTRGRAET